MKGNKKLFGIGAVVLMLIVAFAPVVSSTQSSIEKENDLSNKYETSLLTGYDLKTTIDALYEKPSYDFEFIGNDGVYVEYTIEYTVENIATGIGNGYAGDLEPKLLKKDSTVQIKSWNQLASIGPGKKKSYTHSFKVESSLVESNNKERRISVKDCDLELGLKDEAGIPDRYLGNNIGRRLGILNSDNFFTKTQVESATISESNVEWKPFGDIQIPSFGGGLASLVKSDRLGWTAELSEHVIKICEDLLEIALLIESYITIITPQVLIIQHWLTNVIGVLTLASNGVPPTPSQITSIVNDFRDYILPAISKIVAETITFFGLLKGEIEDLVEHIEALEAFLLTEPWNNPIAVEVDVLMLNCGSNSKDIEITCRGVTFPDTATASENKKTVTFNVENLNYDGESVYGAHDCQLSIKVTCDGVVKEDVSRKILSYVCSDGKLYWKFSFDFQKSRNYQPNFVDMFPFLQQLFSILREKPVLTPLF
jgi:hypothetical protein